MKDRLTILTATLVLIVKWIGVLAAVYMFRTAVLAFSDLGMSLPGPTQLTLRIFPPVVMIALAILTSILILGSLFTSLSVRVKLLSQIAILAFWQCVTVWVLFSLCLPIAKSVTLASA